MVCEPVRRDNPRALARGLLTVQAHKPLRLYGEIIPSFNEGIIDRTGAQTMLYLTCAMISSVDLAHCRVSHAKDWVSVDCGTRVGIRDYFLCFSIKGILMTNHENHFTFFIEK